MFKKFLIFRTLFASFCLFFLLFVFPQKVFAVTFTFQGAPSNILDNQSFPVNITLIASNSAGKNYYIRGAFYQPSTTFYFGYTKNNIGNFYNGEPTIDKAQFYKITMYPNNQWSGVIEFKPYNRSSYYKGPGTYNFKVGRYTESGNTVTWCSNETSPCSVASINIVSSQTPSPSPIPSNSSSPSPSPSSIDTVLLDTSSSDLTPAPNPTSISTSLFDILKATTSSKSVLPVSTKASSFNPTPNSKETKLLADKEINFSKILIGLGFIIIISSAGIFLKSLKK